MKTTAEILTSDLRSVAIAGHVNPDGDCVGSCMALALYIRKNYPGIAVTVYLEDPRDALRFLIEGRDFVKNDLSGIRLTGTDDMAASPKECDSCFCAPDLFVLLDVSTRERIGAAGELFDASENTVCIDHHLSNDRIARINHVCPEVGSCAEVLYELMEKDKIDAEIAEALYTGIIHDTGVFQYSNTRPETLRIAADLITYGFDFSGIIYDSFNARSFTEARFLGHCLDKSLLFAGGRVIACAVTIDEMRSYGVSRKDVGEVVTQLRLTTGTDAAVFAYENEPGIYKVSLRSGPRCDVNEAASRLGGGGHKKAAGCTVAGSYESVIKTVVSEIEKDLS